MIRSAAVVLVLALCGCGMPDVSRFKPSAFGRGALENRVWLAEPDTSEGAVLIFLSDGTLLSGSCGEGYILSPWRRINDTTLAWETDGAVVRAEIALLGPRELALVLDPEGLTESRTYRRAVAPLSCG